MKIVFADQDIFRDYAPYLDCLESLGEQAEITAYCETPCPDEEKYQRLKDADVVVFAVYKIENTLLDRLDNLKMLQFMGIGFETFVDADHCRDKGVIVAGTGDYGSNAVAEFAIAQVFALARRTAKADRRMREGKWVYDGLEGIEVAGSTFGVLGTGRIGRLVAEKASALGARVLACDIYENEDLKRGCGVRYVDPERLFRESDIISIHVKYCSATANLVTDRLIGVMKKSAVLVNAARAEIIDYGALLGAVSNGDIAGAALDVFYDEPLNDFSLCGHPNIMTSPHIGFLTGKAKERCLRECVESIGRYMRSLSRNG